MRTTARADELTPEELRRGAAQLRRKILRYKPGFFALLGVTTYRLAFGVPKASIGRQEEKIGDTTVWVLPNPSGLNAHYQLDRLTEVFGELRRAAEVPRGK
jgi:TDG/mug DNA glycosylase family protein